MQNQPYPVGLWISQASAAMPREKSKASEFGERLTTLRKAAGYTQVELAAALGTTQRMVAYYETRAEKAPAALLPEMALALGASVDELLGIKPLRKSKKPDTRLQRRLQQIEKMEAKERRQLLQVIDAYIEREQLRQRNRAA